MWWSGDGGNLDESQDAEIFVQVNSVLSSALTVSYTLGGTATPGTDYTIVGGTVNYTARTGTFVIPAGTPAFGRHRGFTVRVTGDNVLETDETIILTLVDGSDYNLGSGTRLPVTVKNVVPDLKVSHSALTVPEGITSITSRARFAVELVTMPSQTVTVSVNSNNKEAVRVEAGENNKMVFVTQYWNIPQYVWLFTEEDDDGVNDTATIRVTSSSRDPGYNNRSKTVAVTVEDNDPVGLDISASALEMDEGASKTFTVALKTEPAGGTVTVGVASSDEYVARVSPASLTFTSGNWKTAQTVMVSALEDNDKRDDTARLTVSSSHTGGRKNEYNLGDVHLTVAVEDDDLFPVEPEVRISGGGSVTEGTAAEFTLTRSDAVGEALTVFVNVWEKHEDGQDFVASVEEGNKEVVIPVGSSKATYRVPTVGDNIDEEDGEVFVEVLNGTEYQRRRGEGETYFVSVAVSDDDAGAKPVVSISGGSAVTEGSPARFTVSRSGATASALTVLLRVSENTASGQDFVAAGAEGNREVTIPVGSSTTLYTVSTTGDDTDEPNGEVRVALRSSSDYTPGSASSASVTVNDDDEPPPGTPVVSISGGSPVTEGTSASFTVMASPRPASNLTVNLTVEDAPGADFVSTTNQGSGKTITLGTSGTETITVATQADSNDEPTGTVTVIINSGDGYAVGDTNTDTVTVEDDDATAVTLAGGSGDISEGGSKTFRVTLGRGLRSGESLEVPLTFGGTATRGTDYTTACPGSLPTGITCANLDSGSAAVTFTGPSTGATAAAVTLTLRAARDSEAESGGETVDIGFGTLSAGGLDGGVSETDSLAEFRINDSTSTGTPGITGGGGGITGGGGTPTSPSDDDDSDGSPEDREALESVYGTAGGTGWTRADNWRSEQPLGRWYGVTVEDGRVTELLLGGNNLSGTIHTDIGGLEKLRRLYLNDNRLTGTVPAEVGGLTELGELALWGNPGLETIPEGFEKMVERAVLRTLYDVNGPVGSWFPEQGELFDYSHWGGITVDSDGRISELRLSDAGLSEEITGAVSELSALEALDLSDNAGLCGELPLGLMDTELGELDISGTGICVPDNEELRQWLSGIDFTDTENCTESCGGSDPAESSGGGCAVASGVLGEEAYQFVMLVLILAAVVWRRRL